MLIRTLASAVIAFSLTAPAQASCSFKNEVPVKMLSAGFPAWKAVTATMAECGNFAPELDQEFRKKQPAAFKANPSLYHLGGVAGSTILPLLNDGSIRPLDDLVAKYGKHLKPNQLIKIDGKVMAVAMMVNAQHWMYRSDIYQELGLKEPKTYDDVLAAAEKIKASGKVDYPLGGTFKAGWNIAEDFVNMYLGFGGQFFADGMKPSLVNDAGVNALTMMKKLSAYMDPEFLVSDSTYVQKQFQQGKIAMANLWASRAGAMNDEKESKVVGKITMAPAPAAMASGKPASTLWWDGIVVAKNISDAQADAAFRLAMEGISPKMVAANNDTAVWLIDGFKAGATARGAAETAAAGAPNYPASTAMSLMHTALGNNITQPFCRRSSRSCRRR